MKPEDCGFGLANLFGQAYGWTHDTVRDPCGCKASAVLAQARSTIVSDGVGDADCVQRVVCTAQ
jgi:hypothetical protein